MVAIPDCLIMERVKQALEEDIGPGDATSIATVPDSVLAAADMVARQPLIGCGLDIARSVFLQTCPNLCVTATSKDGEWASSGGILMTLHGSARAILAAERTALNFVQRLSGVATKTAEYCRAIKGFKTRILDTRKTTPGWRLFEKYAASCGGATNHRMGLYDQILIKDNHLVALQNEKPNPIAAAVRRSRACFPHLKVEVEADSLSEVRQAVEAGADVILLDNMSLPELREAIAIVAGRALTEASGGIRLDALRAIAETGVDFISVGALTHSAPAVDIGLDFRV